MSDQNAAQLIAGVVLIALTLGLARIGRKDTVVQQDVQYSLPDKSVRGLTRGTAVPKGEEKLIPTAQKKQQRRSWLAAILVGKDHRTSTSKTVAFAWSLAVAFGLLSLLIALWLGDDDPWDAQVESGLQEEYLLLLGGPYAAGIIAKYAAVGQQDTKTDDQVGNASVSQLVNDDRGNTDLGDFQYVLFNVIALAFFLGAFIGELSKGFPELPAILTGLVLTSAGGYAAKKLVSQAAPVLLSVLPVAAKADTEVQVFSTNLGIPRGMTADGQQLKATVFMGPLKADVIAHDLILGNDRLTVKVPAAGTPGPAPITAARADGVTARGPAGTNILPFEILPP